MAERGLGKEKPQGWVKPVTGLADSDSGLEIVCADQGHPVSLNVRISALGDIIWRKGGNKSSVYIVLSRATRCRIARCRRDTTNTPPGRNEAKDNPSFA